MENLITTLVTEYGLTPVDIIHATFTAVITVYLLNVKLLLIKHTGLDNKNKHDENKGA